MEAKGGLEINGKLYPIPPGETPYCHAKRAEYIEKDLEKAEFFYSRAILQGERLASSVKDLASILHQKNRTAEAVALLRKYSYLYKKDERRFANLLGNLEKQVEPSGNCLNK
jgi:TPR repeat protein